MVYCGEEMRIHIFLRMEELAFISDWPKDKGVPRKPYMKFQKAKGVKMTEKIIEDKNLYLHNSC